jgi:hypothetical protein
MNFSAGLKAFGCVAVLLLAAAQNATCGEPRAQAPVNDGTPQFVSQKLIGSLACGACSLYNMLASGRPELRKIAASLPGATPEERVRHILNKYGEGPSSVYPNRARYSAKTGGIAAEDMHGLANDCLKDFGLKPLSSDYLERKDGETPTQHFRRVHALLLNSVRAGVPPIINVRAYVANPKGDSFQWDGLFGHSVVLVDIDSELRDSDKGFRFRYADSDTGQEKGTVESGYASLEEFRPFSAPRSFSVSPADNQEKWEWKSGSPFLVVTAPSLSLGTQNEANYKRTLITLRHAVYAGK